MHPSIQKQSIESRSVNYVSVYIGTESGCNPEEGEYTLHIGGFIGSLDIGAPSGVDDVSLIQDCVEDNIPEIELPIEGVTELILKESGEWEDVFWHKYYVIDRVIKESF